MGFVVSAEPVEQVRPLRRHVLRRDTPDQNVELPGDDDPATRHLAVRSADGRVVATSTWLEVQSPDRPGARALQLRAMAVADDHRRRGLAMLLVDAGMALAAQRCVAWVWANARDGALDFYRAAGFDVVGEGFVDPHTALPHHRILRPVRPHSQQPATSATATTPGCGNAR